MAAWASAAGLMPAPPGLSEWLHARRRKTQLALLRQAAVAGSVHRALSDAGIPSLFIKGPFLSAALYGDYAARGFGDLDILVPASAHENAQLLLQALGAEHRDPPLPTSLRTRVERVHHASTFTLESYSIDLHRRLDSNPGLMSAPFEEFERRSIWVNIGGQEFPTLGAVDAWVYGASHSAQDNWSDFRSLVDFAVGATAAAATEASHARAVGLGVERRLEIGNALMEACGLPTAAPPTRRARMMANWALARHRAGRSTRSSDQAGDVISHFVYWTLSAGSMRSWRFAAMRLGWLPSMLSQDSWALRVGPVYPLLAPFTAARRVAVRHWSDSGRAGRKAK